MIMRTINLTMPIIIETDGITNEYDTLSYSGNAYNGTLAILLENSSDVIDYRCLNDTLYGVIGGEYEFHTSEDVPQFVYDELENQGFITRAKKECYCLKIDKKEAP